MIRNLVISCVFLFLFSARADFRIAHHARPDCLVIRQGGATPPEIRAAEELARTLEQISGAKFVITNETKRSSSAIIIGPGADAKKYFPEIPFDKLEPDEIIMRVKGNKLLLAGGRPRGTIYAVDRFLQEQYGVRWWTAWATNLPPQVTLKISSKLNVRYVPPFEYRAPFWYPAFEPKWKVHNQSNDENWNIPAELGGSIKYKGYAHTFYHLVPPEKHFAEHPDWYSMIKGQRTHSNAQLCLTNPKLRDFTVQRVKEWLRECPECQIISVTQNDCFGFCECPNCKALDDAEESHAGTMISFVNYIAEQIESEFPNVAVDTFAYQYTRKPPKHIKPRQNVIVRLCSIECNFREPLDHPSNAAFADDIRKWSQICERLYIWDYVTDFKNYVHPHPNWFVLGPNIRFFEKHNVKGIFEEGAYAGHGAEMSEMRSWVLAQLMWNPHLNDRALIGEFLDGYYGREAGPLIFKYLELIHESSKGLYLGCYLRKEPPSHLSFSTLGVAEELWQKAERAVANDPEKLWRVRIAHLPVRCAFLKYWNWLRHDCWERNEKWPLPESRKAVAEEFRTVCAGVEGKDWTHVRVLSEGGLTVDSFLNNLGDDPKPVGPEPPLRLKNPAPPQDLDGLNPKGCLDLQDNTASLSGFGKWAKILPDETASDRRAVWMPGDHSEWAFRISGNLLPDEARRGKWKVYAVVRVKKNEEAATDSGAIAFRAGVYDGKEKSYRAALQVKFNDASGNYHSYLIGEAEFNSDRDIYVSPASNPDVKAIWVDRIFLVPSN